MQFDQLRRREFITLLGGAAAAWPLAARAQQPGRMRLIGVLMGFAEHDPAGQSQLAAFRGALSKLGWTEGSNLRIELRWGAADPDRTKTLTCGAGKSAMCLLRLCVFDLNNARYSTRPYNEGRRFH